MLGRSVGPPWTKDQKTAALAATLVLAKQQGRMATRKSRILNLGSKEKQDWPAETLVATESSSGTHRIFFPTPITCRQSAIHDICIHPPKYALAALIQSVASAFPHQHFQHASHCLYSVHQLIQLGKLSLGEGSPALGGASYIAETEKQVADLIQCKTELTRRLNDRQAVQQRGIVTSLTA